LQRNSFMIQMKPRLIRGFLCHSCTLFANTFCMETDCINFIKQLCPHISFLHFSRVFLICTLRVPSSRLVVSQYIESNIVTSAGNDFISSLRQPAAILVNTRHVTERDTEDMNNERKIKYIYLLMPNSVQLNSILITTLQYLIHFSVSYIL
jgi:hypothetical protein